MVAEQLIVTEAAAAVPNIPKDQRDAKGRKSGAEPTTTTSPNSTLDAMQLPGEQSAGRLADYDVSKAVGKGGYSVVFKGTRKKDQRVVAIKKIEIFDMA
eukprot:CAMPEP_0177781066 /NCGR_PEP_ID=MMETSP0491_2-20121128/17611_1 /TAXON_ID=63592 /ORGANISM="Tetraselmis chuii, Strain PLY429" /LENGTH=98 /DNA_ID=CAMNT_0019301025 /DNA_START=1 /DNA_END=293 /DNA_ORIENTATION=+